MKKKTLFRRINLRWYLKSSIGFDFVRNFSYLLTIQQDTVCLKINTPCYVDLFTNYLFDTNFFLQKCIIRGLKSPGPNKKTRFFH